MATINRLGLVEECCDFLIGMDHLIHFIERMIALLYWIKDFATPKSVVQDHQSAGPRELHKMIVVVDVVDFIGIDKAQVDRALESWQVVESSTTV